MEYVNLSLFLDQKSVLWRDVEETVLTATRRHQTISIYG